jgi:hypothetical protein
MIHTKKGQKRTKIAKDVQNLVRLLQWLYWPVERHNFWMTHSIWPLVSSMTLPNQYLYILFVDLCVITTTTEARTKSSAWYVLWFRGSCTERERDAKIVNFSQSKKTEFFKKSFYLSSIPFCNHYLTWQKSHYVTIFNEPIRNPENALPASHHPSTSV